MLSTNEIRALELEFQDQPTQKLLAWIWDRFGTRAAIGTSFQGAGLVTIHLARTSGCDFPIFTLDTGLLFKETLELKKRLEDFFEVRIESLEPDLTVEQQTAAYGEELWKRDPDLCCTMRKVLPLQSRLAELDCWITGLRREQAESRAKTGLVEVYTLEQPVQRDIVKFNPMVHWSREAIWEYIRKHKIPYNPLHDRGYRSIGCWPCTGQAAGSNHERSGRWVGFQKVECGIHTFMSRKG